MIPLFSYIFFFWHGSLIPVVYEQRVHQGRARTSLTPTDHPASCFSSGLSFF